MSRRQPLERPERFRLNPFSQLAQGLVFGGFGRHVGSTHFHDSSLYGNSGTLTNMDPPTDWVWVSELGRWGLDLASTKHVVVSSRSLVTQPSTLSAWYRPNGEESQAAIISLAHVGWHRHSGIGVRKLWNSPNPGYNYGVGVYKNATTTMSPIYYDPISWVGRWVHIAGVFVADNLRILYYNGVHVANDTTNVSGEPSLGTYLGATATAATNLGRLADPLIYGRILSPSEIQQLADPSNVMLSGLILPPVRRLWSVPSGAAFKPWWAQNRNRLLGAA